MLNIYIYIYLILRTILRVKRQGSSRLARTKHGMSPWLWTGLEGVAVVSLSGIWPKHSWLQPRSPFLRAASGAGFGRGSSAVTHELGACRAYFSFWGLFFSLCFTTSHFLNLLNTLQIAGLGNFLVILFTWKLCAFFGYIYEQFNKLFLKLIWFCNLYRIQEMIKRAILYSLCKYFNCCSVWQNGI